MTAIEIIIYIIFWGTGAFFLRNLYKVIAKPAVSIRMKDAKILVIVVLAIYCTMLFLSPFFIIMDKP